MASRRAGNTRWLSVAVEELNLIGREELKKLARTYPCRGAADRKAARESRR